MLSPKKLATPRCNAPWQQMVIDSTGIVTPCCYWSGYGNDNPPMGNVNDSKLLDIWNSNEYQELRRNMFKGDLANAGCSSCFAIKQGMSLEFRGESRAGVEDEVDSLYFENLNLLKNEIQRGEIKLTSKPMVISYTPSHKCNLSCGHCYQETTRDLEIGRSEAGNEVIDLIPYLDQLVAGGGEPLILPYWRKLIANYDFKTNPQLSFAMTTNATVVTDEIKKGLEKFSRLEVNISIDGTGPVYEFVRKGGVWSSVVSNIVTLRNIVQKKSKSTIGFSCCVMKSTVNDLPKIIEFASKYKLPFTLSPVLTMPINETLNCFNNFDEETSEWKAAFNKSKINMVEKWIPTWMSMNSTSADSYKVLCDEWLKYIEVIESAIPWEAYNEEHYSFEFKLPDYLVDAYKTSIDQKDIYLYVWPLGLKTAVPKYYAKIENNTVALNLPAGKYAVNVGSKWGAEYWENFYIEVKKSFAGSFVFKVKYFGASLNESNYSYFYEITKTFLIGTALERPARWLWRKLISVINSI